MEINVTKLHGELIAAGIPIDGCSACGRIDFRPDATEDQKTLAQEILKNHNPYDYREARAKAYPQISDQLDGHFKGFKTLLEFLKKKFPDAADQEILNGCLEQVIIPCQKVKDSIPKT